MSSYVGHQVVLCILMHSTAFTCQPTVPPTNLPGSSLPAWRPKSPLSYVKKAFVALTENTLGLSVLLGPGWKQRFLYPTSQFPFLIPPFSLTHDPNFHLLTLFALFRSPSTAYAVIITLDQCCGLVELVQSWLAPVPENKFFLNTSLAIKCSFVN